MTNNNYKNNKILALLFVGVLMGALDISIVGSAIPAIERSIEVDRYLISLIFSIYVLSNLVGISLMAKLSDRFRKRRIYMLALPVFSEEQEKRTIGYITHYEVGMPDKNPI